MLSKLMNSLKLNIILTVLIIMDVESSRFFLNENSEIQTSHINLNNPLHRSVLQNNFNLSADEVLRIQSEHKAMRESALPIDENDRFKTLKDDRKEVIRNKIVDIREKISPPEELTHEMAAYPSCNQNNETQWLNENNVTVKFSASFIERNDRNLYLDTAVLRLFKLNPNKTSRTSRSAENNNCDEPMDAQIRVTVSTIQTHRRNRKDRKKRICNTIMLNVSHHGWVEIDVKRAINIWVKFDKNNSNESKPVMIGWLTIEVHDEEERPLKPGLYFEPPKCSQAYPALPWNAYRTYYSTLGEMEKVPKSPRLDVKLIEFRGISSTPTRFNAALNFNAFNQLGSTSFAAVDASLLPSDCNHTHHHHLQHDEHDLNHHSNNVNSDKTIYYADKKLNATARQRIDEILFSTVSAVAPHLSKHVANSSSSMSPSVESRRHIKRNISSQQIEEVDEQQHFQPNHKHRNHISRNNGRRHTKQKQHHQRFVNTNTNSYSWKSNNRSSNSTTNPNSDASSSSSILIEKIRKLSK